MLDGVVKPSSGLHFHFAWWCFGISRR